MPNVSAREIVQRSLLLTLTTPKPREIADAWAFRRIFGSIGLPPFEPAPHQAKPMQKGADQWWERISKQRAWFRIAVGSIVDDASVARKRLHADIDVGLGNGLKLPRFEWDGRKLQESVIFVCSDIESVLAYALVRMLDERDGIWKALRRCKLVSCCRFFLSYPPPGGGPRPQYHTSNCQLAAAKLTGSDRTTKWRRKKQRKAK
jgi:hypothetical protein